MLNVCKKIPPSWLLGKRMKYFRCFLSVASPLLLKFLFTVNLIMTRTNRKTTDYFTIQELSTEKSYRHLSMAPKAYVETSGPSGKWMKYFRCFLSVSRLPLDAMRGSLFDLTTGRISRYFYGFYYKIDYTQKKRKCNTKSTQINQQNTKQAQQLSTSTAIRPQVRAPARQRG